MQVLQGAGIECELLTGAAGLDPSSMVISAEGACACSSRCAGSPPKFTSLPVQSGKPCISMTALLLKGLQDQQFSDIDLPCLLQQECTRELR